MIRTLLARRLAWALVLLSAGASEAYELFPGRVRNPDGLQFYQSTAYNSALDEYLIGYTDGRALVARMTPAGAVGPDIIVSDNIGVNQIAVEYNPDDNTYLVVYRTDGAAVFGRYLTSQGNPIGNRFSIGIGTEPKIAYSHEALRYLVTWFQFSGPAVVVKPVAGDSTSASPVLAGGGTILGAYSSTIAYGSVSQKFLVAYVRDFGPPRKGDIFGRFVSANGTSIGPEFGIYVANETHEKPRAAYAPSTDRWIVTFENWLNCGGSCANASGALVTPSGTVPAAFPIAHTVGWDLPGPVTYNAATNSFIATWRTSFNDFVQEIRAGEFSPSTGALLKPTILLSDLNANPEGVASRPDVDAPQVLTVWRVNNGGDGVHAGIIDFSPPPPPEPDTTPPGSVTDLSGVPGSGNPTVVPATVIAASGQNLAFEAPANVVDGNPATYWSSPVRSGQVTEFLTLDMGSVQNIGRVRLLSRNAGSLFPEDVQIQVSTDNSSFTTVANGTGLSAAASTWHPFDFPAASARYVRVLMTKTRTTPDGVHIAQMAEVEISQVSVAAGSITLFWTAPGDDGNTGTADHYVLKRSLSPITNANFGSATAVATGTPKSAGNQETVTVTGLPDETLVYFALKTVDEANNTSNLSNVLSIGTPGVPPDPVTGLHVDSVTGTSILVSWNSSGDDGSIGSSSSYDLRYSTSPITGANFDAASAIAVPAVAGSTQSQNITGLLNQTTYYIAVKAKDEVGNASTINVGGAVTGTTLDVIAPSSVSTLSAALGAGTATVLPANAIQSSGFVYSFEAMQNATDGNLTTYWGSPPRSSMVQEFITVDTGGVNDIGRVRLRSRNAGIFFPENVLIQVSSDNSSFSTVATATGLSSATSTWHSFDFPPVSARYVRVLVTKSRASADGLYIVQMAEVEVSETAASDQILVSWTSTGDDGIVGAAASYDLRYALSAITNVSQFNAATPIVGEPAPRAFGLSETFAFTAPPTEGLTIHFALRVADDAGNLSPVSNDAPITIPIVPPGAVSDLAASNVTSSSVDLSWTAPGDDGGTGTAVSYDIRRSTSPITAGNFAAATPISGEPTPLEGGTPQSMTVSGLTPGVTYYFAMKTSDEVTVSALSNVVSSATQPPDTTAPGDITDLAGAPGFNVTLLSATAVSASGQNYAFEAPANLTDGDPASYWSSPVRNAMVPEFVTLDLGSVKSVGRVRLLSRNAGAFFPQDIQIQVSDDNSTFATVDTWTNLSSTPGTWHTFDFPATTARYVRVLATKTRQLPDGRYIVQMAEARVYQAEFLVGPIQLSWTAPGDDGSTGQAFAYELRYSMSPITPGNFGSATLVPTSAPKPAGQSESVTVNGFSAEQKVYFALRARDEVPQYSNLAFVDVNTPGAAPAAITDLQAYGPTGSAINLAWTASGDDGTTGNASRYDLRYSTSPINAANFDAATFVDVTATVSQGNTQTKFLSGLQNGTQYFFAVKAIDDVGNTSPINTNGTVTETTLDVVAPAAITTLAVAPAAGTPTLLPAPAIAASGQNYAFEAPAFATDGNLSSYWGSPARTTMTEEFITVDTGSAHSLGRVRLRSRTSGIFFPVDLQVQVSNNNSSFTTVAQGTNLSPATSTWHTFDFSAVSARYVRIRITKTRATADGLFIAQMAEVEVYQATPADRLELTWNAPGDDGNTMGPAASYDVRYSTSAITTNSQFNAATPAPGVPAPAAPGTLQSMTIQGLAPGTYYVAIRTTDDAANTSNLSNVPSATIP